jgi:hypothetical protein
MGQVAHHSVPSIVEIKNVCNLPSTLLHDFLVQCLIKHRDNFKERARALNLRTKVHPKYGKNKFLETCMTNSYGLQEGKAVEIRKPHPQNKIK